MTVSAKNISKKKKFVQDGVFYAELNEFLTRVLGEVGYAGVEIRVTPIRTEIIIKATKTNQVVGEKARKIKELTSLITKRFNFPDNSVELFAKKLDNGGCCAMSQCESLRYKLLSGLAVRRACYGVMNFVMKQGATGVEVIVSGKLRAQRAKVMKFRDGYLISTGEPKKHYIQEAARHVKLRQGVLGVKVKIMLSYDPTGKNGTSMMMPDKVQILEPKPELPVVLTNGVDDVIQQQGGDNDDEQQRGVDIQQEEQEYQENTQVQQQQEQVQQQQQQQVQDNTQQQQQQQVQQQQVQQQQVQQQMQQPVQQQYDQNQNYNNQGFNNQYNQYQQNQGGYSQGGYSYNQGYDGKNW